LEFPFLSWELPQGLCWARNLHERLDFCLGRRRNWLLVEENVLTTADLAQVFWPPRTFLMDFDDFDWEDAAIFGGIAGFVESP